MATHTHTHILLTSAAANHLLTSPNGSQYGLLQSGLHVLRLFERQAVDPLQRLLPLQQPSTITGQRQITTKELRSVNYQNKNYSMRHY